MANTFVKENHDIVITDPSTADTVGFVLDRDGDKPAFAELDGDSIVDLFNSDSPTQYSTNPQKDLPLGQTSWHAGIGSELQDTSKPFEYHKSNGCDLRHKGMAIAGWTSTGITPGVTITPAAVLANGDMEDDSDWTNGNQSQAQKHGGADSWLCNNEEAYDDATTWSDTWQSKAFLLVGWVYCGTASKGKIGLNDGKTTTYSSLNATTGAWEYLYIHKVLASDATRLRIVMNSVDATDVYFDDFTLFSPTIDVIPPYGHATFNSLEYIAVGNVLAKLNGAGNGLTSVGCFPVNIKCLEPFRITSTDYLFIGLDSTTYPYWYMVTAETFTESIAAYKYMHYFKWVNTTVDTMYAKMAGYNNLIVSTVSPINGGTAWSDNTYVGDGATPITGLYEKSGALLIDKEDMPYYLDSSGNVQTDLAPECKSGESTHSGKNSAIWLGEYFRPTGDQALLRAGTTNEWVQPSKYTMNNSDLTGQVEAVAGDEEWCYIAVDNSTKVEILAGREETIDGTTAWRWHPIHELTLTGVSTMWISTVVQKRLWISSTTSSEQLFYLPLPTKYGDITNDSNACFLTGTTWEPKWLHGDFPTHNKAGIDLTLIMGHTYDADIYWTVGYKKMGDADFTNIGNFDGSATSMIETKFLAAATTSRTSPMWKLQFTAVTDDTDKTPILYGYKLGTILYMSIQRVLLARVKVMKNSLDIAGLSQGEDYEIQKTCLENCRAASFPITLTEYVTDKEGQARYVRLLPLPSNLLWKEPVKKIKGHDPELIYTLLMLEKPLA